MKGKLGRPKKLAGVVRGKVVLVRLSYWEDAFVRQLAKNEGQKLSDWMRDKLLSRFNAWMKSQARFE